MGCSADTIKRRTFFIFKKAIRTGIIAAAFFTSSSAFADEPDAVEKTTATPVVSMEESDSSETLEGTNAELPLLEEYADSKEMSEKENPVNEENDLEVEEENPVNEENGLEVEKEKPVNEENDLEVEEEKPVNEENDLEVEKEKPANEENGLEVEEEKPVNEENGLEVKEEKPANEENGLEVEEEKPVNEENGLEVEEEKQTNEKSDSELEKEKQANEVSHDGVTKLIGDSENSTQDESIIMPEDHFFIEAVPTESDTTTIMEENPKEEKVQKATPKQAEKEEAKVQKRTSIEVEVESQIKELISAKVNAQIEAERKEQLNLFIKKVSTAQIQMDKKLKDWSVAIKQLVYVNKAAKAIKVKNGKPDMNQVAIIIGQYQAIANKLAAADRDPDFVNMVTIAVEILKKKKVEANITVQFVKETIRTSNDLNILVKNLNKQHLVLSELVEYQKELKEKEELLKEIDSSSRLPLYKIALLHFGE
ncbi:hypothetical protein [Neobacillus sp. D3-1R]|uniref:hypothetical protein n=1 Tax=Neobacillus sp. D3-1R TaxID=3445778 RepID=UPI003FA12EFB